MRIIWFAWFAFLRITRIIDSQDSQNMWFAANKNIRKEKYSQRITCESYDSQITDLYTQKLDPNVKLGGGTSFSKLHYLREFSNIMFKKLTNIRYKRSLWTIFWKFQKPVSIWVLVGGFNFRLGTYNVPSGSRPKHLHNEAEGRVSATSLNNSQLRRALCSISLLAT